MASPTSDSYAATSGQTIYAGCSAPTTEPPPATALALSGPTTGTTGSPATFTVIPNGPLAAATIVTLAATNSGALSVSTLTFASGATAAQTFTVTRSTDGTSSVSITNDHGLTNSGTPIGFVSSAPPAYPWMSTTGDVVAIGYASGAHPSSGAYATRLDASPQGKSWNPSPGDVGPWGGGSPGARMHSWANHTSYCGFAWCETTQEYATVAGGHATPCVPAPLAFRLSDLSWNWLTIPVPSDAYSLGATNTLSAHPASVAALTQVYPAGQLDVEWGEWQGGYSGWGAYARPGEIFPECGHTDTSIIWVPGDAIGNTNGAIIPLNQASGRWDGGEKTISHWFDLDVGQKKWKRLANKRFNTSTGAGGSIYFGGAVKKLFSLTHGSTQTRTTMDVLDPATKTWATRTSTNGAPISIRSCGMGAHIPSGLLLSICQVRADGGQYYPGVTQEFWAVDAATAAAGSHTWVKLNISAASWPLNEAGSTDYVGWMFCPRNGCFYATDGRHGSTTLWKLTPPVGATSQAQYLSGTWTITTVSLDTTISSRNGAGGSGNTGTDYFIYNRLVWNELAGCAMWQEEFNQGRMQRIRIPGV